jgi:hypothetical protein
MMLQSISSRDEDVIEVEYFVDQESNHQPFGLVCQGD